MDIVVTGASGFIGAALLKELAAAGLRAVPAKRGEPLPKGDVCVHLASSNDPGDIERRYMEHLREGEELARRIASAGYGRVVYASSALVYGDGASEPRREESPTRPVSAYGRLKLELERFFHGPTMAVARISNVYGPGMSPVNVFSHIAPQLSGGVVRVRSLDSTRDYLWIEDAAAALAALARSEAAGVFNVGTGRGARVDELIRVMAAARGLPVPRMEAPPSEPSCLVLDPSKLERAVGFAPRVTLEEGLKALPA